MQAPLSKQRTPVSEPSTVVWASGVRREGEGQDHERGQEKSVHGHAPVSKSLGCREGPEVYPTPGSPLAGLRQACGKDLRDPPVAFHSML